MPELANVATFLGLDPGSFGEVDDRSALLALTERPRARRPDDRMRRIVEFLGIEFTPAVRARPMERWERRVEAPEPPEPLVERPEPLIESPEPLVESPERGWRRVDDDILYQPTSGIRRFRR